MPVKAGTGQWSPERIYDQLVNLGSNPPSPNTIRKYLQKPTHDRNKSFQSWKTFITNHMDVTWSMDFFVAPTLTFRLLYVFIIISHERRKIIHFGTTWHPSMLWVIQQLKEATEFGIQPKYIITDNDRIYGSGVPAFQELRDRRSPHCFPLPLANPFAERVIGKLRRDLLDHVIPLSEQHLSKLQKEYIPRYYHPVRTHSSLDHRSPAIDLLVNQQLLSPDDVLESEPILGGIYHYRAKAA